MNDNSSTRRFPRLVLFDLDGTLLDSAPDMLATANRMRAARGLAPLPMGALRPHVSKGSRAMTAIALETNGAEVDASLVREFLQVYQQELGQHGTAFEGIDHLLQTIEQDGARWGIVTNKPEYLAKQLLPILGWQSRCAVLIGGDTLPQRKPHPLPLLHAAQSLGASVENCVYVGDDERDIIAARAAGMSAFVALWGYRLPEENPQQWGADVLVHAPADLLRRDVWP